MDKIEEILNNLRSNVDFKMVSYSGKVLPETQYFHLVPLVWVIGDSIGNPTTIIQCEILHGSVWAEVFGLEDEPTLRNRLFFQLDSMLARFSLLEGQSFSLILEAKSEIDTSSGQRNTSALQWDLLEAKAKDSRVREYLTSLRDTVDLALSSVLRDFRSSILDADLTGFYSYRLTETLAKTVVDSTDWTQQTNPSQWKTFREALKIEEYSESSVLGFLTRHSTPQRHGNVKHKMSGDDRVLCIAIARSLIERYILWRLGEMTDEQILTLASIQGN